MKNPKLIAILLVAIQSTCSAQIEYIPLKSSSVHIDSADFFISQVRDTRTDTNNVGKVYSPKLNKYVSAQITGGSASAIGSLLLPAVTGESKQLTPVTLIIKQLTITEDTASHHHKKGTVMVTLAIEKMLDGKMQECFNASSSATISSYTQINGSTLYGPQITLLVQDFLQLFNSQVHSKQVSLAASTNINSVVFNTINPKGVDTISWAVNSHLQAHDFTGMVPASERFTPVLSGAAVNFIVNAIALADTSGYKIVINTGTLFIKSRSWIKAAGEKDEFDILFEQMKFDLAKIYELKFISQLRITTFSYGNVSTQVNTIYSFFQNQFNNATAEMVGECQNANNNAESKRKFNQWQVKIKKELQNFAAL